MTWQAVVRDSDGELVSVGTVLAKPLPAGLVAIDLSGEPDGEVVEWSKLTRAFVARAPAVVRDRIADFLADTEITRLQASVKTTLQARLVAHFGDVRNA